MKKFGWLVFAAVLIIGVAILAYQAGYTVGADIAERDNRAEAVE